MLSLPITREELQRVHHALRIATPLDQLSPLMVSTLTMVAHCWRRKGLPKCVQEPACMPPRISRRQAEHKSPATIDLKRRAAGDLD